MNETWTRRLLLASAGWNIAGAATSLADPANHFASMYAVPPPLAGDALLMYFYQCTWINVLAWGGAYALAATWQRSRAAVLVAGGAGKALYFVACAALVASGVGKPLVLAFGLGDLLMACAVQRRRFPVGARPTRQPLQPEATGAVMEVTKWLKPSDSASRHTVTCASVQAAT